MELIQILTNVVQAVGVPVVCLGAVMWYVNQLDIRQRDERASLMQSHSDESHKWVDALNANTAVMQKLINLLDRKDVINDDL